MERNLITEMQDMHSRECSEINNKKSFDIYDCRKNDISKICSSPNDPIQFTVYNPIEKDIYFLAIDNCLIKGNATKRCDFIIHDSETLCLVELKGNVKLNQRKSKRRDAKKQLIATITYMKDYLKNDYIIEAYISIGISQVRPSTSARETVDAFEFANLGVKLREQRSKRFD